MSETVRLNPEGMGQRLPELFHFPEGLMEIMWEDSDRSDTLDFTDDSLQDFAPQGHGAAERTMTGPDGRIEYLDM